MGVTKQNRVDARHFTEVIDGVLSHRLIRIGRQSGVGDDDHDICAFLAHLWHILTRGFGDVVHGHFAGEISLIPRHDLRRHKADITDFQRLFFTVLIDHFSLFDQVRRKERLFGFNVNDIGVNVREFRASERIVQIIQPVVKFVITEVAHRVIQGIQRLIDRVNVTLF